MKTKLLCVFIAFLFVTPNIITHAQSPSEKIQLPEGFIMETVLEGIPSAGAAAFAPNGMVFLAGKHGVVLTYVNGKLNPDAFIDISDEVNSYWDRGLLGIAVHPQFPDKPYIYLLYTYDPPGAKKDGQGARVSRLIRVSADPANLAKAIPSSKVVLLGKNSTFDNLGDEKNAATVDKPACYDLNKKIDIEDCLPSDSPSHSIGTVMFAMDGSLLVGTGEGSHFEFLDQRAARAQNLNALSGKILRINPETGEGLPDNPFFTGNPKDNKSRVWDYGLRNPFRFTQNPETGEIVIGDVGWNIWEEINTGKGKNFGWPCFEGANNGNHPQPGFESNPGFVSICQPFYTTGAKSITAPLFSYETGDGGAVVVGPYYAGTTYPEEYHGVLFYGDYDRKTIRYLHQHQNSPPESHEFVSGLDDLGGPVQLLAGPDGDLYCVVYNEETDSSKLIHFVYDPNGNKHGHISISASPTEGNLPLNVQFRITSSSFAAADLASLVWNFGDGTTSTGEIVSHSYAKEGKYLVKVSGKNKQQTVISNEISIFAGNNSPNPEIISPSAEYQYRTGDRVDLIGKAIDPEDGAIPPAQLKWDVFIHHKSHVHTDFFHSTGSTSSFFVPDHGDKVWLEVCLTAVDSKKLDKKVCKPVMPKTSTVNFSSNPSGLMIVYEGESKTTPFDETPVINSMMETDTLQNQLCMKFDHWSDGGPRSHSTLIGENDISLEAFYKGILPENWTNSVIGQNVDGTGCLLNGNMYIWPSTQGFNQSGDGLNYINTTVNDDFTFTTEIPFEKERLSPRLSGFLIRQSLSVDSPSLFVGWDGERKLQIYSRKLSSEAFQNATIKSMPLLAWQKISRKGEKYTWSQSSDGKKWDQIAVITFPFTRQVQVGLSVFDSAGENFGPVEFNNTKIISDHP
jgi:glucose/arabinose dehydrogenase/regulation of enolase protein 1 (concanavalin A-like superfamily)